MPTASPTMGLYFSKKSFDQEAVNALRARLNAIAATFGCVAAGGPSAGDGNLAALLPLIDDGSVALVKLSADQRDALIAVLRQLAEHHSDATVVAAAEAVAGALEMARGRGEETR